MKKKSIFLLGISLMIINVVMGQKSQKKYGELLVVYQQIGDQSNPFQVKIKAKLSNLTPNNHSDSLDRVSFAKTEQYDSITNALTYLSDEEWIVESMGYIGNTIRIILYKSETVAKNPVVN